MNMAITTATGTIGRTFFDGKGAEVVETFKKRDGSDGTTRWSAFFEQPHGLTEGQAVSISGLHGDKIDPWEKDGETRHTIKRTLNKACVVKADTATPVQRQASAPDPAADVWNSPASADDGLPF